MDNKLLNVAGHFQELMIQNKLSLSLAESCTGGMISSLLTDIAGSSEYFYGAVVSYSNQAKMQLLNVDSDILSQYGAVSEQAAYAMAHNSRHINNTDIAASVTGIAGPGGGSEVKPVGLVYIAVSSKHGTEARKHLFHGSRDSIRKQSTLAVLDHITEIVSADL